ncbi:restriction endonuclease subunit S [Elizabethkingia anophelis]|nr:restriction endonuclease subunit S [Elizabethkingia anophelis]
MSTKTTYKQTELGLIPEDWEVKKFNKFSKFYSGGTPLTSKSEYYGGEIPFIKSGEIYYDRTEQFLTQEGLNNSSAKLVYRGDLLYALYGANSGEVAISQLEGAINQAILCIQQNKDEAETIYLYNYLKLEKSNIINKFLQGGQGNLSADIIKNLQIPLPPLPEQKKIADCLSTWDVAIEKQNALINALTERKKALMQQLLTGKKRLPGFSEEWKEVKLGEICEIKKGSQINKIELSSNLGFPVINGGIEPSGYHDDWNVAENTITISEGGNSCGFINFIKEKFWSGGHCYTLQNLKININKIFLFYFLKNSENQIMKLRVGSGLPNIQQKDIKNFEILLPKIEEQTAIAEILATADRELQLQKEKLAQLQTQKKGLMQVLLTGKKRLMN